MSLRKPLTLNWKGKDYTLMVTMEVIDRLEDHISLGVMVRRCSNGDIRLAHAAKLIALLLSEAGCKVTQAEVYEGLFDREEFTPADLGNMLKLIFAAIFPEQKKKSESSDEGKKSSLRPAKTSRGNPSTKSRS